MKQVTIKLSLLLLPLLALTACVKQKDCDCSHIEEGQFSYREGRSNNWKTVKADFTPHIGSGKRIYGKIPKKFQSGDTLHVRICLDEGMDVSGKNKDNVVWAHQIQCIEKIK